MKVPIIISAIILIAALILTIWMNTLGLCENDYIGLAIGAWSAAGALVSAAFIVYGYLINLEVFKHSQRPQLLMFVDNAQATLIKSGELVHQTRINYRNISSNECENLQLFAQLVSGSEKIDIPRLFNSPINLQASDSRVRDFPTKTYLLSNGIDKHVINNLCNYKLRVGYSFSSLGKIVKRSFDYAWDSEMEKWNIA